MYTVYEEYVVIRKILENYCHEQQQIYHSLAEGVGKLKLEVEDRESLNTLRARVNQLEGVSNQYSYAKTALSRLEKAALTFGWEEKEKANESEGKSFLQNFKTENDCYGLVMSDLSTKIHSKKDSHFSGLEEGIESKITSLRQEYEAGDMTKEQFIYYVNMCPFLIKNLEYEQALSGEKQY